MKGQRSGIRIRGHRGDPVVRRAVVRYLKWLRKRYEFPVRVPVYLSPMRQIVTVHGKKVSASFFAPWDRCEEPYIRLATGDYRELSRELGRDDALATFLCSLSHEVLHYQQWIADEPLTELGIERRAVRMLRAYAATVAHP